MIEVTSRHTECAHFNLGCCQMSAVKQQLATQSVLVLTWTTIGCLPSHNNGKPDKEATSSPMKLDGSVFSHAAQAMVESLSPNVKTAF